MKTVKEYIYCMFYKQQFFTDMSLESMIESTKIKAKLFFILINFLFVVIFFTLVANSKFVPFKNQLLNIINCFKKALFLQSSL